jgi:DNA-binding NtrC family response regulator
MKNNLVTDSNDKKNILFVDDEEALIKSTEIILRRNGYEVTVAKRSKEALRLVQAVHDRFDLLITDMNMDQINGIDLGKEVKQIAPDIPIILCTGEIPVDQQEMIEAGIAESIQKPFTTKEFMSIIDKLIGE